MLDALTAIERVRLALALSDADTAAEFDADDVDTLLKAYDRLLDQKGPVTQPWVHGISFMQQTVLLTAVRGPDGIAKYHNVKFLLRWFRRCTLVSSLDGCILTDPQDPRGGSFMGPSYGTQPHGSDAAGRDWRTWMDGIVSDYLRAVDELPHHFQLHFLHATEIVGYKHPCPTIAGWWRKTYERLVHDMHLWPETKEQLDTRLGDSREGWLARNDEATVS